MQRTKRLFAAIHLPDNLKNTLAQKQAEIKGFFPDEFQKTAFKWVEPQNFHITWQFFGAIKESAMLRLLENLKKEAAALQPFDITLGEICFDNTKSPRFIWVNANGGGKQFHITLARVRQWQFNKINPEELPDIAQEIAFSFSVKSLDLMESQLTRQGPVYSVLQSFSL